MLGSQRVVLFGKIVEPPGREALQEEVGPWRRAFRIYILVSFLIYSLLPICWCKVISGLRTGHCPPKVLIFEKSKQGPSTGPVAWCWLCGLMGRDALAVCDVLRLCHHPFFLARRWHCLSSCFTRSLYLLLIQVEAMLGLWETCETQRCRVEIRYQREAYAFIPKFDLVLGRLWGDRISRGIKIHYWKLCYDEGYVSMIDPQWIYELEEFMF